MNILLNVIEVPFKVPILAIFYLILFLKFIIFFPVIGQVIFLLIFFWEETLTWTWVRLLILRTGCFWNLWFGWSIRVNKPLLVHHLFQRVMLFLLSLAWLGALLLDRVNLLLLANFCNLSIDPRSLIWKLLPKCSLFLVSIQTVSVTIDSEIFDQPFLLDWCH